LAGAGGKHHDYCRFFARLLWQDGIVTRKRIKKKRFRAVEAVKALARERIGTPPAERVLPNPKKKKTEKHKPTLGNLLQDE
jgi:hypothetical protein